MRWVSLVLVLSLLGCAQPVSQLTREVESAYFFVQLPG